MKNENDECTRRFGAGVLLKHILDLQQEIEGVRQAEDIECIHRMRVASRRLRSALPLFEKYLPARKLDTYYKQIRKITRALGTARDQDVQIDHLEHVLAEIPNPKLTIGIRRLLLRINQKRRHQQEVVQKTLDSLVSSRVLSDMQTRLAEIPPLEEQMPYSLALYQLAHDAISQKLDDFFSFEQYITQPERILELHAMRISAKWLRYTQETFTPLYSNELGQSLGATRKAQEQLGEIHDKDVWIIFLPGFLKDERQLTLDFYGHTRPYNPIVPGILYFQQTCRTERDEAYAGFLKSWEKWKKQNLWEDLNITIRTPIQQIQNLYPPQLPLAETTSQEPNQ